MVGWRWAGRMRAEGGSVGLGRRVRWRQRSERKRMSVGVGCWMGWIVVDSVLEMEMLCREVCGRCAWLFSTMLRRSAKATRITPGSTNDRRDLNDRTEQTCTRARLTTPPTAITHLLLSPHNTHASHQIHINCLSALHHLTITADPTCRGDVLTAIQANPSRACRCEHNLNRL